MTNLLNKKNVIKVNTLLKKFDKNLNLIVLNQTARTAKEAAKSLNTFEGAIVKSLLFKNELLNVFYLCLVSGDKYVSISKLSTLIGSNIIKATANECKKFTGYSIGGVPPIGHINKPKKIFIDESLNKYDQIYAAAGHPYVVFGIDFNELCLITSGEVNKIVQ